MRGVKAEKIDSLIKNDETVKLRWRWITLEMGHMNEGIGEKRIILAMGPHYVPLSLDRGCDVDTACRRFGLFCGTCSWTVEG